MNETSFCGVCTLTGLERLSKGHGQLRQVLTKIVTSVWAELQLSIQYPVFPAGIAEGLGHEFLL